MKAEFIMRLKGVKGFLLMMQKVINYVSKGAVTTLFVMVPYIFWPF